MWVRAVWLEKDVEEEAVIPSYWVKGGYVFWPPVVDAVRAMRDGKQPNEKWHKFPLVQIKKSSGNCEYWK